MKHALFLSLVLSMNAFSQNAGERGGEHTTIRRGQYIFCKSLTNQTISVRCHEETCSAIEVCESYGMEVDHSFRSRLIKNPNRLY